MNDTGETGKQYDRTFTAAEINAFLLQSAPLAATLNKNCLIFDPMLIAKTTTIREYGLGY